MLYEKLYRIKHTRDDGWLSEIVSVNYDDEPFNCIHSYLVSINPGKVRAKHYHRKKEEWIAPVSGKVVLHLKNILSGEHDKIILDTSSIGYEFLYIPPFVAHAVYNTWEREACIIVFSKNPEDQEDTILYEFLFENV